MMKVEPMSEARAGLETDRVREQHVPAARAVRFTGGNERGDHDRGRVPGPRVRSVVEIERVRGDAVHQRRIDAAQALRAAEHQAWPARLPELERVVEHARRL